MNFSTCDKIHKTQDKLRQVVLARFKIPLEWRMSSVQHRRATRLPSITSTENITWSPLSEPFLFVQKEIQQRVFPHSGVHLPPLRNWLEKQRWAGELTMFTENLCAPEYFCIGKIRLNLPRQTETLVAAGSTFYWQTLWIQSTSQPSGSGWACGHQGGPT